MRWFRNFVKWFLYITTGILVICGINYKLAGVETVSTDIFWNILFCGLATTLATVLLLPKEEDGRTVSYLKFALHYVVLCIIMVPVGVWFGWISLSLSGVVKMAVDVGGVYLLAVVAYCITDYRQADEINRRLKEKYGDSE